MLTLCRLVVFVNITVVQADVSNQIGSPQSILDVNHQLPPQQQPYGIVLILLVLYTISSILFCQLLLSLQLQRTILLVPAPTGRSLRARLLPTVARHMDKVIDC